MRAFCGKGRLVLFSCVLDVLLDEILRSLKEMLFFFLLLVNFFGLGVLFEVWMTFHVLIYHKIA